jgi:hypothetical protein
MDLVTLVTACALTVDPKLMHALVWHQSGGEPWAVSVQGEPSPRVYSNMRDAIREVRSGSIQGSARVGLAGVSVSPSRISASVLLPCRNVAMAADQIARHAGRCKTHPRLKTEPMLCAVAVYRGSWAQPDIKFATDVVATAAKGDAPNFDMPPGTSTAIFDTAEDQPSDADAAIVDVTLDFAERSRSWSSALFPPKARPSGSERKHDTSAPAATAEPPDTNPFAASPSQPNAENRDLFVRRSPHERTP